MHIVKYIGRVTVAKKRAQKDIISFISSKKKMSYIVLDFENTKNER